MVIINNLDYLCIKHGQKLPRNKESERIIRKALGILQEDGLYAMFLWLEVNGSEIRKKTINLFNEESIIRETLEINNDVPEFFGEFCKVLAKIAQDLDKLLFLKKIFERIFIYALYHAKIGEQNE